MFTDSRYADGLFAKTYDARNSTYVYSVYRNFPYKSINFYYYVWTIDDRIDLLAYKLLGNADFWPRIMDINPEIINPLNIAPGTTLRIPNA